MRGWHQWTKRIKGRLNEGMSDKYWEIEWDEGVSENGWIQEVNGLNELDGWMNEWTNAWTHEWLNEWN